MKALDIAKEFIGQTEKPNNGGFYNTRLQAIMSAAGHKKGEAWCCYFAEACFCEPVKDTPKEHELRLLFSANCVQTLKNFEKAGYKISQTPVEGALVIFRRYVNGIPQTTGHAGLCELAHDDANFTSIEGNTNDDGGSEGELVLPKIRNTTKKRTGLNVEGFVIIE